MMHDLSNIFSHIIQNYEQFKRGYVYRQLSHDFRLRVKLTHDTLLYKHNNDNQKKAHLSYFGCPGNCFRKDLKSW